MKKGLAILSILLIIGAIYAIRVGAVREGKNQKKLVVLARQYSEERKIEVAKILNLNIYGKIFQQRDIEALIIGDGVGQSEGASSSDDKWFNIIKKDVKQKYKSNMTTHLITGESTTAVSAWAQLNSSKLTEKYDIAFICLGQNDQFTIKPEQFKSFYESIIIKLKIINPKIEIIPIMENTFRQYNEYSNAIVDLSKHYNLQYADTIQAFNSLEQPYESLIKDVVHPNDSGYRYYASTIEKIINDNYTANKKTDINYSVLYQGAKKLNNFIYNIPTEANNGFALDNGLISNKVGDALTFNTTNSVAIINFLRQPSGGKFKVFIDDKLMEEIDTNKTLSVSYSNLISDSLEGQHKIKIEVSSIDNGGIVKILGLSTN